MSQKSQDLTEGNLLFEVVSLKGEFTVLYTCMDAKGNTDSTVPTNKMAQVKRRRQQIVLQQEGKERTEEQQRELNLRRLARRKKGLQERRLEELVLGREDELVEEMCTGTVDDVATQLESDSDSSDDDQEQTKASVEARVPVWRDEDDEADELVNVTKGYLQHYVQNKAEEALTKSKLQERLRDEFVKAVGGVPAWADAPARKKTRKEMKKKREKETIAGDSDESEDESDELVRRTGNHLAPSAALPRGVIAVKRCTDANRAQPAVGTLTTMRFHPTASVVMAAGMDENIRLFQVDGQANPLIQTVHLEQFPVVRARFYPDGSTLMATTVRSTSFYRYDMILGSVTRVRGIRGLQESYIRRFELSPDGKIMAVEGTSGYTHLVNLKTTELVGHVKVNGKITSSVFSLDGQTLYTTSDSGEVYIWDVGMRRCINRFSDDGSNDTTSIAVNDTYVACGSESGIVNVYEKDACLQTRIPKPLKILKGLVTSVSQLAFHPSGEMLATASSQKADALCLVHMRSLSTFSNFPAKEKLGLGRPRSLQFSPGGGYMGLATGHAKATLYRLKHYKNF
uniref:U3 small nucleolar RNA-associated protein 18 homolog isoform X1 n=1 Tax=Myxine glutinosa TaxID=7769 RepID=UPI00358EF957